MWSNLRKERHDDSREIRAVLVISGNDMAEEHGAIRVYF